MQIEQYVEAQAKLKKLLNKYDKDSIRPIFDAVLSTGKMKCIYWPQYTPSFNDGEPCLFQVHMPRCITSVSDLLKVADTSEEDLEAEIKRSKECSEDFWSDYTGSRYGSFLTPKLEGVPQVDVDRLNAFFDCEDLCEVVFGDYTEVTAVWNEDNKCTDFYTCEAGDY